MLLAHAKAWHTYDKEFRKVQKGKVSIVVNGQWYEPKSTKEEDIQAADRGMQWFLGWMAHPVFIGDYPEVMKSRIKEKSEAVGITSRLFSLHEACLKVKVHQHHRNFQIKSCTLLAHLLL